MLREERVSLDYYIDGEAHRPFAFRVLVPQALRAIDAVTPPPMDQVVDRWGGEWIAALGSFRSDAPAGTSADIRSGPQKNTRALFSSWLCCTSPV